MDKVEIIRKFQTMRQSTEGKVTAPHKPLLVLYAIGRLLRDQDPLRPFPYCSEIDKNLGKLLEEFGPRESKSRTHQPFWRLKNDKIWEIRDPQKKCVRQTSKKDAFKSDLRKYNIIGGFREAIAEQFLNDSELVAEVVQMLLYKNFPPSIHEDILRAVEIESPIQIFQWQRLYSDRRRRDSSFRPNILSAYENKCAVCSFDATLGTTPIGLEAAHIKWHTHHGPDVVVNGLALCSLHHKLFDRGAFTLSEERELLVSGEVCRSFGSEEWLMKFHGKQINLPQKEDDYPALKFIKWHVRAVFKGKSREL
jgi:putative restriction endonuclease